MQHLQTLLNTLSRLFSKQAKFWLSAGGQTLKFITATLTQFSLYLKKTAKGLQSFLLDKIPPPNPRPKLSLKQRLKRISQCLSVWGAFLFLITCLSLAIAALLPSIANFEGNVIVSQLSFTYRGTSPNQLFLHSIRPFQRLELQGEQPTLTLYGQFTSASIPDLSPFTPLEIVLDRPESRLILEPLPPNPSQLELTELRLQPQTKVSQLFYQPFGNLMGLKIIPQTPEEPNITQTPKTPNILLSLGTNPIKITLENYHLPTLSPENRPPESYPLELTFVPINTELRLALNHEVSLTLDLPNLPPTRDQDWLGGNLPVEQVNFTQERRTGELRDQFEVSSIQAGQVRMGDELIELQPNQFFSAVGEPGISSFPRLQLHPEEPAGIEVRFSGQARKIEIGIDRNLPVKSIWTSLLNRYLPQDLITGLMGFLGAAIGSLLYWFVDSNFRDSNPTK